MIHAGSDKGRRCVAGRTVLCADRGMNLVSRGTGGRQATRHMAALALRGTNGIVVHYDTGPNRVTVAQLTTVQAGMVWRTGFIRRMATTGGTTRGNKGMIHPGPDKRGG